MKSKLSYIRPHTVFYLSGTQHTDTPQESDAHLPESVFFSSMRDKRMWPDLLRHEKTKDIIFLINKE